MGNGDERRGLGYERMVVEGLPGVAYWCGTLGCILDDGGACDRYLSQLAACGERLRRYSVIAGNAITIPEFFNSRFHDKKNLIMGVAAYSY